MGSALTAAVLSRASPSGTRRRRPTGPRGPRWRATSRPTSRSSAPGSPGSGPPTTSPWRSPSLRIVVLEAEVAGFGASGRNGGWCSALFPASLRSLAGFARGRDAQDAAMRATVDEVLRVARPRASTATRPRAARSCWRGTGPSGCVRAGRVRRRGRCSPPPRPASGCGRPGPSARRTPRTARPSTPAGWCAGSPTRSTGAAS